MAYQQKPNYFSIFPNDKKEKDTHPDWKGSITLADGQEYWFDGWNKQTKDGKGYISGKIGNPKQNQAPTYGAAYQPAKASSDDDIPF